MRHCSANIPSVLALAALVSLIGVASCDLVEELGLDVVTVELVNATGYPVEPRLFVDDDDSTILEGNITENQNRIATGVIAPGGTVVVTVDCKTTMMTDHAEMLLPLGEVIESDCDPVLREKDDFDCFDVIRFTFVDTGDEFCTFVEVNGYPVED